MQSWSHTWTQSHGGSPCNPFQTQHVVVTGTTVNLTLGGLGDGVSPSRLSAGIGQP